MTESDHHAVVRQHYDQRADAYLASSVHAAGSDLDLIAGRVGEQPGAVVLDMGCGGGHVSFRLAPAVGQVVACDLSPAMLDTVVAEAARRGLANVVTRQGAAETLPFAPESFAAVVSRYSAHHWRDLAAGIRELHRVLTPGGVAIFSDLLAPEAALLDTWLQSVELLRDPSHVRNARLSEWAQVLGAAGFAIEQITTARLRLEFASWVGRTRTPDAQVQAIRTLQVGASGETRRYFDVAEDGSFSVDTGVFVAGKRV